MDEYLDIKGGFSAIYINLMSITFHWIKRLILIYTSMQSSLMYKLNQIYVRRGKFRLTIFPGIIDHSLIVALLVIYLNARK
jgi:hypothetical protein